MQPNPLIYSDEEVTHGGFTYKRTVNASGSIFPMNSDIDESIAYTISSNDYYNHTHAVGWNASTATTYVTKNLYWSKTYGSNSYCNVNSVFVDNAVNVESGVSLICFTEGTGSSPETFAFGYDIDGDSTYNQYNSKFITDFDVSRALFIPALTGCTKSDMETWLADTTTSGAPNTYDISFADFMSSPNDYCIATFSCQTKAWWDNENETWVGTGYGYPAISAALLLKYPSTGQLLSYRRIAGTGGFSASDTQNYRDLYNSSSTNATNIGKLSLSGSARRAMYTTGFAVGEPTQTSIEIKPLLTTDELDTLCNNNVVGTYYKHGKSDQNFSDFLDVYETDQYRNVLDATDSTTSHINMYWKRFWSFYKSDKLIEILAMVGVYMSTLSASELNTAGITPDTLNHAGIYLGEMLSDGKTTGRFIVGTDIANYTGINKSGSIIHNGFDPTNQSQYVNDGEVNMPLTQLATGAGFVDYYKINTTYNGNATATATEISAALSRFDISQLGKDLLRNLISYKVFAMFNSTGDSYKQITIGGHGLEDDNNNQLKGVQVDQMRPITINPISIPKLYNDYRDYAPYTKIEMYIPCCGWFVLPPWCVGKTITGAIFIDLYNGTCKAVILASQTVVAEVGGSVSYDVPFVAESVGAKTSAVISSALSTAASAATTYATPNIGTALSTVASAANLATSINANYTELKGILGDGSNINGLTEVYIKVSRPKSPSGYTTIPDSYKREYGIPTCKELTLNQGDGFTQIQNPIINGNMTATEKRMLIDGLRHGLIL